MQTTKFERYANSVQAILINPRWKCETRLVQSDSQETAYQKGETKPREGKSTNEDFSSEEEEDEKDVFEKNKGVK